MKYLRKYNESNTDYIIEELECIAIELKDEGFDFKVETWNDYIIFYILPGENNDINDLVIETTYRVIDFMYQNSYDLGSNNWVYDGKDKIRIKTVSSDYYSITKKELIEFNNFPFKGIQLVFKAII